MSAEQIPGAKGVTDELVAHTAEPPINAAAQAPYDRFNPANPYGDNYAGQGAAPNEPVAPREVRQQDFARDLKRLATEFATDANLYGFTHKSDDAKNRLHKAIDAAQSLCWEFVDRIHEQ